jgi:hypothetical protein
MCANCTLAEPLGRTSATSDANSCNKAEGRAVAQAGGAQQAGRAAGGESWQPLRIVQSGALLAEQLRFPTALLPEKFIERQPINLSWRKWSGEVVHKR